MLGRDCLNMRFWRCALRFCVQHDPCAVRVIGADEIGSMSSHPLESDENVGLHVLEHMAEMNGPIRVGQSGSHED